MLDHSINNIEIRFIQYTLQFRAFVHDLQFFYDSKCSEIVFDSSRYQKIYLGSITDQEKDVSIF